MTVAEVWTCLTRRNYYYYLNYLSTTCHFIIIMYDGIVILLRSVFSCQLSTIKYVNVTHNYRKIKYGEHNYAQNKNW